jgi:hypothetical protein
VFEVMAVLPILALVLITRLPSHGAAGGIAVWPRIRRRARAMTE